MIERIITIGVYGYTAVSFYAALQAASVDILVDIRWRRGVRGAEYAFANSQRLQARLAELDIGYLHRRDLAPPPAVRQQQQAHDKTAQVAKRQRQVLSPSFVAAYKEQVWEAFDPASLQEAVPADARVMALLCVEKLPEACHRSLVADKLAAAWQIPLTHLIP